MIPHSFESHKLLIVSSPQGCSLCNTVNTPWLNLQQLPVCMDKKKKKVEGDKYVWVIHELQTKYAFDVHVL